MISKNPHIWPNFFLLALKERKYPKINSNTHSSYSNHLLFFKNIVKTRFISIFISMCNVLDAVKCGQMNKKTRRSMINLFYGFYFHNINTPSYCYYKHLLFYALYWIQNRPKNWPDDKQKRKCFVFSFIFFSAQCVGLFHVLIKYACMEIYFKSLN